MSKIRQEVRKSDMNTVGTVYTCEYGGLFSTNETWIHPDRTEATYEIIYVTNGKVYMNIEGTEYCAEKGHLLLLEPNKRHFGSRESTDVGFYWVHFYIENGKLPFSACHLKKFDNGYLFKELLHHLFLPKRPDYLINAILAHILSQIQYNVNERSENTNKSAEEINEWIRANISAKLTVEKTAKQFGFSADHVSRLLKKQYHVSAKTLINKYLLQKAMELLSNTGKYIKEIAYELEFTNDKAFIVFFRYHEGISPSDFRDRLYKIHMNNH